jgi:hypothetical protein
MKTPSNVDSRAWTTALRDAITARDEPLYRRELMQFLATRESVALVDALIHRPAALAVMRRSFRALAGPLGLADAKDMVAWLSDDEAKPRLVEDGARDVVSVALPYFRFARGWARAAHKETSYAAALALMFFEPVLQLCEPVAKAAKREEPATAVPSSEAGRVARAEAQRPAVREAQPSLAHLTQRA